MKQLRVFFNKYCVLFLLLLLPNCGKVVDWVHGSFEQISSVGANCQVAEKYIKSVTEYDQFTTAAKFDALWLSNEIRMTYVNLFGIKFGKTEEQKKALLRRQLEENNHFISFFILSLYECPLGDPHSVWTLFLTINNKNYAPIEIKSIELSPEYECMFGKKFNRFKVAYSVKFDAKNVEELPLITSDIQTMTLCFRSIKKEVSLEWDVSASFLSNNNQEVS